MEDWLNIDVWLIVKIVYLLAIGLYALFATVVVRQVSLMTRALKEKTNPSLRLLSWFHLGFAGLVFLIALFFL